MNWDYATVSVFYVEKCKQCDKQNHWEMNIFDNQHHWLENGLKLMGNQGWELVTIQQVWFGQSIAYSPAFWYIFKKPLIETSS